jgi:rubrerythrin
MKMRKENGMIWVCNICDYEEESDTPPAECPICGAGADAFEEKK